MVFGGIVVDLVSGDGGPKGERVVFDVCQSENVLKWKWVFGGSAVQCKRGDLRVVECSVFGAERLDFFQLVTRSGSGVHRHISTIERDDGSCDPC